MPHVVHAFQSANPLKLAVSIQNGYQSCLRKGIHLPSSMPVESTHDHTRKPKLCVASFAAHGCLGDPNAAVCCRETVPMHWHHAAVSA